MTKRRIISYFLMPILLVYLIFSTFNINVFASDVNNIVQSYDGNWSGLPYTFYSSGKYYKIDNSNNYISTSTYATPKFYYTNDGVKFDEVIGTSLLTTVLNKTVGIIVNPENINTFVTGYLDSIKGLDSDYNLYVCNGLYDTNDNFLGYALNDITGCYYAKDTFQNVNVPSDITKNIYNYNKYINQGNTTNVDFFTFYPPSFDYFSDTLDMSYYNSTDVFNISSAYNGYDYLFYIETNGFGVSRVQNPQVRCFFANNDCFFVSDNNSTSWANFCNTFNLKGNNNTLYYNDLLNASNYAYITYYVKTLANANYSLYQFNFRNNEYETSQTNKSFQLGVNSSTTKIYPLCNAITIYKTYSVYTGLENNTYMPDYFYTNNYYNYSADKDYSFNINKSVIDNSVTTNETVYTNISEDYYDYYDNGVVDSNNLIDNSTTIINNYYPVNDTGGDNGGDNGGGNGDNDGILDTLLAAILGFFEAIGKVIATIITGLLDMFSSVLSAIAEITNDLTGFTDFLGSLFSWLPSPVPQVLGVGLSICILCAVIKFIRG